MSPNTMLEKIKQNLYEGAPLLQKIVGTPEFSRLKAGFPFDPHAKTLIQQCKF